MPRVGGGWHWWDGEWRCSAVGFHQFSLDVDVRGGVGRSQSCFEWSNLVELDSREAASESWGIIFIYILVNLPNFYGKRWKELIKTIHCFGKHGWSEHLILRAQFLSPSLKETEIVSDPDRFLYISLQVKTGNLQALTWLGFTAMLSLKWKAGIKEPVKESSKKKRPGENIFSEKGPEQKAEGRTALARVSPPSWSHCCERCPFLSPGLLPPRFSWGAGTTCDHSYPSPISSSEDQVSLHQKTKGEGTSWVASPGSQTFLCQGAKLPLISRPCVPVACGRKPPISSLLPLFPGSPERWQGLIQPCWRLKELRPSCK